MSKPCQTCFQTQTLIQLKAGWGSERIRLPGVQRDEQNMKTAHECQQCWTILRALATVLQPREAPKYQAGMHSRVTSIHMTVICTVHCDYEPTFSSEGPSS